MTEPPFLLKTTEMDTERKKGNCYREQPTRDEMQVAGLPVLAGEEGGPVFDRIFSFHLFISELARGRYS